MIQGLAKRWIVAEPLPDAGALATALDVGPLIAQVLCRRGISGVDAGRAFLQPRLNDLDDPASLGQIDRAAERITAALRADEPIVIYGDYDVDGITATAILYHTLCTARPGANIRRYIPHRIDEGYGLNSEAIAHLAERGAKLIITVDCGVTAVQSAAVAQQHGVDLIITDHHGLDAELPSAHAIVHPMIDDDGNRRPDHSERPISPLCGAGVAYKLAWQIARHWCGTDRVSQVFRELLVDLLPLAALGTVADVVPLVGENRIITRFGLGRVKHTSNVGLNALIDAAKLRDERIDSYHVGFVLGPRLNACGRMGHAKTACKLLTSADAAESARIAQRLEAFNEQRRATERRIFEQACERVEQRGDDDPSVRAIVLGDDRWHAGVIGIVCSRLVDRYGKPAILISTANGVGQGSGRSIDGYDLHAALCRCGGHLLSYGGHAMAGGLKIDPSRVEAFREAMIGDAGERLTADDLLPVLHLDGQASMNLLDVPVSEQLEQLGPFGRGNPRPAVFMRGLQVDQTNTMGSRGRHLSLLLREGRTVMRGVGWRMGELAARLPAGIELDVAARPKINRWGGRARAELELLDVRIHGNGVSK
jgi:single-stranded-DNA-specific exonuclease